MDVLSDLNIKPNSKIFIEPAQLGTDFQASLQFGNGSYTTNEFNLKVDNGTLAINVASSDSNETAAISISTGGETIFNSVPAVGTTDKKLALKEDITTALSDYTTTDALNALLSSGYVSRTADQIIEGAKTFSGAVTIDTLNVTDFSVDNLEILESTTFGSIPTVDGQGSLALVSQIPTDYVSTEDFNTALEGKANLATTLAGYGITDAYTKSEVDGKFITLDGNEIITGTKTFSGEVSIDQLSVNSFAVDSLTVSTNTSFNGTINVPTVASTDSSTNAASTAFVHSVVSSLGTVLNYKGVATSISDDFTTVTTSSGTVTAADANKGDVYIIPDDTNGGVEYVSDGSIWQKIGYNTDLSGYQEKLTFDTTPTSDSVNPVTSGGLYNKFLNYITTTTADGKYVSRTEDQIIEGTKTFVDPVTIATLNVADFAVDNLEITTSTAFNGTVTFASTPKVNGNDLALYNQIPTDYIPDTATINGLTVATNPTLYAGDIKISSTDATTIATAISDLESTKADKATIDANFVSRTADQIIEGTKTFSGTVNIATLTAEDFTIDNLNITTSTTFGSIPTVSGQGSLALASQIPTDYVSESDFNTALEGKADVGVSYTKSESDSLLSNYVSINGNETITGTKTFSDTVSIDTLNVTDFSVDNLEITDTTTFGSIPTVTGHGSLALKSEIPTDYVSESDFNTALEGKADAGASYTKAESDSLLSNYVSINGNEIITGTKTFSGEVSIDQLSVNSFAVDSLTVSTNTSFSGTMTVPVVDNTEDSSTKAASTAFVHSVVEDKISSLGTVLNYKGVATSISDDFVTITTSSGTVTASSENVGDVYIIPGTENNSGIEYVSDGSIWQKIGYNTDLSGYQEKLTFDTTPVSGSLNPVTSGGLFAKFGNYNTITEADGKYVSLKDDQIIEGTKTFVDPVTIDTLNVTDFSVDNFEITTSTTFGSIPTVSGQGSLALASQIPTDYVSESDFNTALEGKADAATTLAGYKIGDAYTSSFIDANFISRTTDQIIEGTKTFSETVNITTLNVTDFSVDNLNITTSTTFANTPSVTNIGLLATQQYVDNQISNISGFVTVDGNDVINGTKTFSGSVSIDTLSVTDFSVDNLEITDTTTFGSTPSVTNIGLLATQQYVDNQISNISGFVTIDGNDVITGTKTFSEIVNIATLNVTDFSVDNLSITTSTTFGTTPTVTNVGLLATQQYVDNQISSISGFVTIDDDQIITGTKTFSSVSIDNLAANNFEIDSLNITGQTTFANTPSVTNNGLLATQQYVDNQISGISGFVTVNGDDVITGTKTFSETVNIATLNVTDFSVDNLSITTSTTFGATPSVTDIGLLATQQYVDNQISAIDGFVTLDSEQTITGAKTFSDAVTIDTLNVTDFSVDNLNITTSTTFGTTPSVTNVGLLATQQYVDNQISSISGFVTVDDDQIITGTKTFSGAVNIATLTAEDFTIDNLNITTSTTFGSTPTVTNVGLLATQQYVDNQISAIDGFVTLGGNDVITGTKTFSETVNIATLNVTDFSVDNLEITTSTTFANTPTVTNVGPLATQQYVDNQISGISGFVTVDGDQIITGTKTFSDVSIDNLAANNFEIGSLNITGQTTFASVPTVNGNSLVVENKYIEMNVPAMAVGTTSVTMTLSTTFTKRPILQLMRVSDGEVVMATLNYKLENGASKVTVSIAHTEAITAGQYVLHAFGV